MTRTFFPGGSYCDAIPGSGEYCVLFYGQRVDTHRGALTLPVGEQGPLFLRCSNVGGFKFAGQAHDSNGGYEWTEGNGWRAFGPPVCGISPVIYDRLGILHVSDCSIGSQGWRFVDNDGTPEGHLVTGDLSYGSGVGLSEWSAFRELYFGQGHDGGGALVYDGDVLRVLETGDCRFIRVQGEGEKVAISFVKPTGAVIVQTTLAELRALPKVGTTLPDPGTPPVPVPQPTPEPSPVSIPNQLNVVQRVRANYPTPLAGQHPAFLIALAKALGGKLFRKDGGSHVTLPNGVNVSQDIVIVPGPDGPWWVDVLGDAEGEARPTWDAHPNAGGEFVDVTGVGTQPPAQPPSEPPTQPPAPSVDLTPLLNKYNELDSRHEALVSIVAGLAAKVEALTMRLQAVETRPEPVYRASGSTSRDYGHSHKVNVTLERLR